MGPDELHEVPGNPMYRITETGNVWSVRKKKFLSPCVLKWGGYLAVVLWTDGKGKTRTVHQLVAEAFHGPRPSRKHDAAHYDGNKWNNHRANIRWATRAENEADKIRHGKSNHGERCGRAKLSNSQVTEIRERLAAGEMGSSIAADYPVKRGVIYRIKHGRTYVI